MPIVLSGLILGGGFAGLILFVLWKGRTVAPRQRPAFLRVVIGIVLVAAALLSGYLPWPASAPDALALLPGLIGLGGAVLLAEGAFRLAGRAEAEPDAAKVLSTAIEGISEGILYFDKDDRLVLVNGKIADIYPLAKDVFVPGVTYETCLRTGVAVGQWGPRNGRDPERWIQDRLAYHRDPKGIAEFHMDDGRVIRVVEQRTGDGGIVGIRADITDLRRAEMKIQAQRDELEKLNRQKDRFFAIIAHDLKSPFASLLGFTRVLSSNAVKLKPEEVSEYCGMVNRAAEQAYKLLQDLLDWSRLQLDRMEFNPRPMDVRKAVHSNFERMAPVAGRKRIRFENRVQEDLKVRADAHMVDTILRNLIDNAIKFTPDDGTIQVGARAQDGFGIIEVTDTGVGITQESIENLFRLDHKVSTVGTKGETGTGLGLHLCKQLVERQGGILSVESEEGAGTSFRFTLPLLAA